MGELSSDKRFLGTVQVACKKRSSYNDRLSAGKQGKGDMCTVGQRERIPRENVRETELSSTEAEFFAPLNR